MKWLLSFLSIVGAAVYFGLVNVSLPPDLKALFGLAPPSNARAVEDFSQAVLQPLESQQAIATSSAQTTLAELRSKLAAERDQPDYARRMQVLNLLDQALAERSAILSQLEQGTPGNRLDEVPGRWHWVGHPEKNSDPSHNTRQSGYEPLNYKAAGR